ncbi:MAG: crossover junction endodeoxyribonuclease RuvC [Saprospiraceae bacterium]|nr:crossover junction endodeoxyribonuclease RuvC [Saprospiraceae bacterium]
MCAGVNKTNHITYRLLGVDPGTNILGYAVLEIRQNEPHILEIDVIHLKKYENQQEKLHQIFQQLDVIIKNFQPNHMAIEAPFFGKNVQSMLKLGRAQGVAIAAAMTNNIPITEYSPKKIKQSVTGNGNASKEQIAGLLSNMFKATLQDHYYDATDALAIALCHFYQSKNIVISTQKNKPKKVKGSNWATFVAQNSDKIIKP